MWRRQRVTPSEEHLAADAEKGEATEKRPDRKSPALQWAFPCLQGRVDHPLVLRNTCVDMEMGQLPAISGIDLGRFKGLRAHAVYLPVLMYAPCWPASSEVAAKWIVVVDVYRLQTCAKPHAQSRPA